MSVKHEIRRFMDREAFDLGLILLLSPFWLPVWLLGWAVQNLAWLVTGGKP